MYHILKEKKDDFTAQFFFCRDSPGRLQQGGTASFFKKEKKKQFESPFFSLPDL